MHPSIKAWIPPPVLLARRERALACLGAFAGLLLTEWSARMVLGTGGLWFVLPLAASAVLLFAVPASPLAQPWSVFGGNVVAALVGVACARFIAVPALAASVALALAIAAMFSLRCLHPPAGAIAVTPVLGGPAVHALGFSFVLVPVALNCACMVLVALVLNNLLRQRYPHVVHLPTNQHGTADPAPLERLGFTRADIDAALRDYNELLDVSEDDLEGIFHQVELQAFSRRTGVVRCRDIMSRDVVVAHPAMRIGEAWQLLQHHDLRSLPVVHEGGRLAGIVTLRDLSANPDAAPLAARTVGEVMTTHVQVARPGQSMADLVPLFSDAGFHHLPVVDAQQQVVGMVTQSDVLALLFRTPV